MKSLAIIAIVAAAVLGAVGSYIAYDQHDQLETLRKLQDIYRTLQRESQDIAVGSRTGVEQAIGMSTANMAESKVNQYQREIDLHESYQTTAYIFIGTSLALLSFGVIALARKRGQAVPVLPIETNNATQAAAVQKMSNLTGAEGGESKSEQRSDSWVTMSLVIGCGVIIVIAVIVLGSHRPATTSTSAPAATVSAPEPAREPGQQPPQGYWQVDADTSPVTGLVTTTAFLKYQSKQNIYVRQRGKKLELYIDTDEFLETVANVESRHSPVQYKFDDGKLVRQSWIISGDNEALFY